MKLGGYTFAWDPSKWEPPVPEKKQASVTTFSGVGYFSWGATIVGKQIDLEWEFMSQAQFDSLQALFEADAYVLWDLDVAGMMNYYVEITELVAELPEVVGYDQGYIHNVRVTLLILSETAAQGS